MDWKHPDMFPEGQSPENFKIPFMLQPPRLYVGPAWFQREILIPQAHDFLIASGKLQTIAYKHEIEAALRTPGFGGFQLLDLHDFPGQGTALVGVLDAFWDEKGYVTPEEYSRFCSPTVPLLRTGRFVLTTGQSLEAAAQLAHFGPDDLKKQIFKWSLTDTADKNLASGAFPARDHATGDLHALGSLHVPLAGIETPAQLVLTISSPDIQIQNSWGFFVYPEEGAETTPSPTPPVTVPPDLDEAFAALEKGKSVLWLPAPANVRNDPKHPLRAGFSPIFWNTAWTNFSPPHTLGLLCDPAHPPRRPPAPPKPARLHEQQQIRTGDHPYSRRSEVPSAPASSKATRFEKRTLRVHTSRGGPFASLAEIDVVRSRPWPIEHPEYPNAHSARPPSSNVCVWGKGKAAGRGQNPQRG